MRTCPGCTTALRWYHRKAGPDKKWHRLCHASWRTGFEAAMTVNKKEDHADILVTDLMNRKGYSPHATE